MVVKKVLDKNKRGFAVQFNWLFVLLGGAVILGFFISLITNQIYQEEQKTDQQAAQELENLLRVSLAAKNTLKTVDFVDKRIRFYCDEISEYYVGEALRSTRYDYNAVFSPTELMGKELVIQTLVFKAPFKVIPLVYITNKDIEYVFVINSSVIAQIYNAMPGNTTVRAVHNPQDISAYPDNNYERVVFVLDIRNKSGLNNRLTNFDSGQNSEKVYAVVINTTNPYYYGNISFFKYASKQGFVYNGSAPFLGLELLLGAVISHDKIIYDCTLRKVLQRLALLSKLHERRMAYYSAHTHSSCSSLYTAPGDSAQAYLKDISRYSEEAQHTTALTPFRNLLIAITQLKSLNNYILTKIKAQSCPLIY